MPGQEKIVVIVDIDLEDLIPGFLKNRMADVETLKSALVEGKLATIQSIGHSLKGVGGGYGFDQLSNFGADLELKAKSGELDGISELIDKITDYLERIEIKYE